MRWLPYALEQRTELRFGHGCTGYCMLLQDERYYALGMDALAAVCSWNTNGIMVWACMHWLPYAFGTQTEVWCGHGCCGHRMFLKHEQNSHCTSRKRPAYPHLGFVPWQNILRAPTTSTIALLPLLILRGSYQQLLLRRRLRRLPRLRRLRRRRLLLLVLLYYYLWCCFLTVQYSGMCPLKTARRVWLLRSRSLPS